MKMFNGPRPIKQITENMKKYGFFLDSTQYDQGSDYLDYYVGTIEGQRIMLVMVCPWDGRFIACDYDKTILGSERSNLDGIPWYDSLLEAIYEPLSDMTEATLQPVKDDRSIAKQALAKDHLAIAKLSVNQALRKDIPDLAILMEAL